MGYHGKLARVGAERVATLGWHFADPVVRQEKLFEVIEAGDAREVSEKLRQLRGWRGAEWDYADVVCCSKAAEEDEPRFRFGRRTEDWDDERGIEQESSIAHGIHGTSFTLEPEGGC